MFPAERDLRSLYSGFPICFFPKKQESEALSRQIKQVYVGAVVLGRCRSVGGGQYRVQVTLRVGYGASLTENFTAVKTRY